MDGISLSKSVMFIRSIVITFFISFSLAACAADNDFNVVCDIFKQLQSHPDFGKLSPQQKEAFVTERINKTLNTSSAAKISWDAIVAAEPSQRYEIFKSGAEDVLGKPWTCEPMQQLAATVGG